MLAEFIDRQGVEEYDIGIENKSFVQNDSFDLILGFLFGHEKRFAFFCPLKAAGNQR